MKSSKIRKLDGETKRKTFIKIGIVLLILVSFFGGYFAQYALRGSGEKVVADFVGIMDQIGYVYDKETGEYVKLEGDKIVSLINESFLDDYSKYYTKEEYQKILKEDSGEYNGFGISIRVKEKDDKGELQDISLKDGTNVIYSLQGNSPAYNAGFKEGDKVLSAKLEQDMQITHFNNAKELGDYIKDVAFGKPVIFTVERQGETQPIEITCKKENYEVCYVFYKDNEKAMSFAPIFKAKMTTVEDAYNVINETEQVDTTFSDDVGYIKLTAFEGDAGLQFGAALKYMVDKRGKTKLVLDLCDNGGGSMSILQQVSYYLFEKNSVRIAVAYEKLDAKEGEEFSGNYQTTYFTNDRVFNDVRHTYVNEIESICVLANDNTASASECLIGALMHHCQKGFSQSRLVVVDNNNDDSYTTYGKGVMQTTYELTSGGALKITTAKVYWPDKKTCINKIGIATEVKENKVDTYLEGLNRAVAIANS